MKTEKFSGFLEAHSEDIGDTFSVPAKFIKLGSVAPTIAVLAGYMSVGHKIHFQFYPAGPFASLTASPFGVKGKNARIVAAHIRLR
jgi:hypothetical protein